MAKSNPLTAGYVPHAGSNTLLKILFQDVFHITLSHSVPATRAGKDLPELLRSHLVGTEESLRCT
jgi:hypothetical protein